MTSHQFNTLRDVYTAIAGVREKLMECDGDDAQRFARMLLSQEATLASLLIDETQRRAEDY